MNLFQKLFAYCFVNEVKAGNSQYYPEIKPILLRGSRGDVMSLAKEAFLQGGPNWELQKYSVEDCSITGKLKTKFFKFKDDFKITLREVDGSQDQWEIFAESSSRIGQGDFGKNARNLRNFYDRLDDMRSKN